MDSCQLVVFTLGEEEYAVNISFTQEIMRVPKLTKIPNVPQFIEGIFNLRGNIIPILNLKKRFGITQSDNIDSKLLVLEIDKMKVGIIVDDVLEVIRIDKKSVQDLDDEIAGISKNAIDGICLVKERIIILLNALKLKSEIFKCNLERELVV